MFDSSVLLGNQRLYAIGAMDLGYIRGYRADSSTFLRLRGHGSTRFEATPLSPSSLAPAWRSKRGLSAEASSVSSTGREYRVGEE